jgi:hypothetical protein
VALTTHHQLAPRLKKEYSYTSTSVGLRGLFYGELYLYLIPVAVYTEQYLLMMSCKPAGNM